MVGEVLAEGDVIDVKVIAKNSKDEGIARFEDSVIFIKDQDLRIGKEYKVKILKKFRTYFVAKVVELQQYTYKEGGQEPASEATQKSAVQT